MKVQRRKNPKQRLKRTHSSQQCLPLSDWNTKHNDIIVAPDDDLSASAESTATNMTSKIESRNPLANDSDSDISDVETEKIKRNTSYSLEENSKLVNVDKSEVYMC